MAFKDWEGKWVELRTTLVTNGGKVFPKGLIMLCGGTHRGTLSLGPPVDHGGGLRVCQTGIRRVRHSEVTPVDGHIPEVAKKRPAPVRFSVVLNKSEAMHLMNLLADSQDDIRSSRIRERIRKAMS